MPHPARRRRRRDRAGGRAADDALRRRARREHRRRADRQRHHRACEDGGDVREDALFRQPPLQLRQAAGKSAQGIPRTRMKLDDLLRWLFTAAAPAATRGKARLLALDTLGCMLAGLESPTVRRLATLVDNRSAVLATAACWDETCEGLARAHG